MCTMLCTGSSGVDSGGECTGVLQGNSEERMQGGSVFGGASMDQNHPLVEANLP